MGGNPRAKRLRRSFHLSCYHSILKFKCGGPIVALFLSYGQISDSSECMLAPEQDYIQGILSRSNPNYILFTFSSTITNNPINHKREQTWRQQLPPPRQAPAPFPSSPIMNSTTAAAKYPSCLNESPSRTQPNPPAGRRITVAYQHTVLWTVS